MLNNTINKARNIWGNQKFRRVFFFLLKVVFTIIVVLVLIKICGGTKNLRSVLEGVSGQWLAAMYFLSLLNRIVEAYLLRSIITRAAAPIASLRVFLANSLSVLYSLIAPGDLVASVAKWHNLTVAVGDKYIVLCSMAYSRISILLPPIVFGLVSFCFFNPFSQRQSNILIFSMVATIICVLVLALLAKYSGVFSGRGPNFFRKWVPELIKRQLNSLTKSLVEFRGFTWKDHCRFGLISILAFVLNAGVLAFAAKSFEIDVTPFAFLWMYALLLVIRHLPITIGSLGVSEGVMIFALSFYGVASDVALAMGLVVFSAVLLFAFVGAAYQSVMVLKSITVRSA